MTKKLFKFDNFYCEDDVIYYNDVEFIRDIGEFSAGDGFVVATLDLNTGEFQVFVDGEYATVGNLFLSVV